MGINEEGIGIARNRSKQSPGYLLILYGLLVYLSIQLHEMGHGLMATFLGLKFTLGFNQWRIISDTNTFQKLGVLAAGPAMTLALIAVGFLILYATKGMVLKRLGLFLAISNALMAFIANISSLIGGRGDTGWIALYLKLPHETVSLPLILVSVLAMIAGFKRLEPEMRKVQWVLGFFIIPGVVLGLIILLDKMIWRSIEHGKLLFPIWGTSAITLLVNFFLFTMFLLLLWKESSS